MKLPNSVYQYLYEKFGIMNCKKCGELMFNPNDDKIVRHIETKHSEEL